MRIIIMVGLPGAGKTTYLSRAGVRALSSDIIREILTDDVTDQTANDRVFETVRYVLRQRLKLGRPETYIDATNLSPEERAPFLEIGKLYGCDMEAVFFDVPLEICMERNRARNRVVPEDAMRRLAAKLVPPAGDEGFQKIRVVRPAE